MEVEKEIMELKEHVVKLDTEVGNLNGWQKAQNGALLRVDQKVDNLQKWILGVLAGVVASIFINLLKP